ncbi:putative regulatory protein [Sulfolobales Mexican fusellovirus 1]|uniref:putative regulatory protein n=1 Tax=Sulfolobales Mexican fusellovirus 1 TaxID=1298531 RepID=UPI0002C15C18|nr:putative regulatory protein [Sulfolobales Mexican fusellovirus 1]AGG36548.1 putative regulatory protein [Sulfolobales Mexican fusellovirus 1]
MSKVKYTPVEGSYFLLYKKGKEYVQVKLGEMYFRLGKSELRLLGLLRMLGEEVNKRDPRLTVMQTSTRDYNERLRRLASKGLIVTRREGNQYYLRLSRLGQLLIEAIAPKYYDPEVEQT